MHGAAHSPFYSAPMVHWPEVMVSYDAADHILSPPMFRHLPQRRALPMRWILTGTGWTRPAATHQHRGQYGPQVLALLKKVEGLDVRMVAPARSDLAHGPGLSDGQI